MAIDVEIRDFQSIRKIAFRIDGFSAFVGRSNIGKSAVVRALRCALTGAVGTDFVRHGDKCERRAKGTKKCKCFASVRIAMPELTFLWEKGDAVNQYTVWQKGETGDGTVYSKIDRGTPEFLLPLFAPVKVGTGQELLQVSEQFAPIFLLNQSGNTVADVLSDVARLDQINVAMGLVNKDRKSALSTRKVREKDLEVLETSLKHYEGLDDAITQVRGVEGHYKAIETAQEALEQLNGYLDTLRGLAVVMRALKVATAPEPPDAGDLSAKGTRLAELDRFHEDVTEREVVVQRLETATAPETPDAADLTAKGARVAELDQFHQAVAEREPVVQRLEGIDEVAVPEVSPLQEAEAKLAQIEGWVGQLRGFKAKLKHQKALEALPELSGKPTQEARDRLDALEGYLAKRDRLEKAQKKLADELAVVEAEEQEIQVTFGELGVCPTCSQGIEADHCLHLEGE